MSLVRIWAPWCKKKNTFREKLHFEGWTVKSLIFLKVVLESELNHEGQEAVSVVLTNVSQP